MWIPCEWWANICESVALVLCSVAPSSARVSLQSLMVPLGASAESVLCETLSIVSWNCILRNVVHSLLLPAAEADSGAALGPVMPDWSRLNGQRRWTDGPYTRTIGVFLWDFELAAVQYNYGPRLNSMVDIWQIGLSCSLSFPLNVMKTSPSINWDVI